MLRSNGQTAAVTGDVGDEFRSVFDNVSCRAGICMQTDFLADWHGMTLPSPEFSRQPERITVPISAIHSRAAAGRSD